jgi:hypothetical protein
MWLRVKTLVRHPPFAVMLSFDPVQSVQVERVIHHLQPQTSQLDAVPVYVLKKCTSEMAIVISHLVNMLFSTGCFPRTMKIGWITPLLRKAGPDIPYLKKFCSITNLSTISKILEWLALN